MPYSGLCKGTDTQQRKGQFSESTLLARQKRRPSGYSSRSRDPGTDDAIIKISSTAICGSDLHLYDGFMMGMEKGDVLGHEPMGIVVEVGRSVAKLKKGHRIVVPFVIACGHCFFCTKQLYSCCDTTNPNAEKASKLMGHAPAAICLYSHSLRHFLKCGDSGYTSGRRTPANLTKPL